MPDAVISTLAACYFLAGVSVAICLLTTEREWGVVVEWLQRVVAACVGVFLTLMLVLIWPVVVCIVVAELRGGGR